MQNYITNMFNFLNESKTDHKFIPKMQKSSVVFDEKFDRNRVVGEQQSMDNYSKHECIVALFSYCKKSLKLKSYWLTAKKTQG